MIVDVFLVYGIPYFVDDMVLIDLEAGLLDVDSHGRAWGYRCCVFCLSWG